MRTSFSLIAAFLAVILLPAAEPLWEYAPASTAILFHVDAQAIRKTALYKKVSESPEAKRLMGEKPEFKPEDLASLLLVTDHEADKLSWIAGFSDKSVLPEVMRKFQKNLTKLPAKPLQYRIKCQFGLFDELRFVPWDGNVAGIYPKRGAVTREGAPAKVRALAAKLPKDALAFGVGLPRFDDPPFDAMKEFAVVVRPKGDKLMLQAFADCGDQLNAAFFGTSLMAFVSMWLQNAAGLTPEEAAAEIAKCKIRQRGSRLLLTVDDLETLVRSSLNAFAAIDQIQNKMIEKR